MHTFTFVSTCVNDTIYVPDLMPPADFAAEKVVRFTSTESEILADLIYFGTTDVDEFYHIHTDRLVDLGLIIPAAVKYVDGYTELGDKWVRRIDQFCLTPLGYQVAFNLFVEPAGTTNDEVEG